MLILINYNKVFIIEVYFLVKNKNYPLPDAKLVNGYKLPDNYKIEDLKYL
jgi:hypothetical protein